MTARRLLAIALLVVAVPAMLYGTSSEAWFAERPPKAAEPERCARGDRFCAPRELLEAIVDDLVPHVVVGLREMKSCTRDRCQTHGLSEMRVEAITFIIAGSVAFYSALLATGAAALSGALAAMGRPHRWSRRLALACFTTVMVASATFLATQPRVLAEFEVTTAPILAIGGGMAGGIAVLFQLLEDRRRRVLLASATAFE